MDMVCEGHRWAKPGKTCSESQGVLKVQFVYLPFILTAGKNVEVASFSARFLWELDMPSRSPLDTLDFPLPLVAFLSLSNFFLSLPFSSSNFEGFFLLHQKPLILCRLLVIRSRAPHEHEEVTYYIIHASLRL